MANTAVQRYRLIIGTRHSGTLICIGACRDEDAVTKAELILSRISGPDAGFRLQRANGSVLSARAPSPQGF